MQNGSLNKYVAAGYYQGFGCNSAATSSVWKDSLVNYQRIDYSYIGGTGGGQGMALPDFIRGEGRWYLARIDFSPSCLTSAIFDLASS